MKIRVIEDGLVEKDTIEVIHVEFDINVLQVTVRIDGYRINIEFDAPVGYRVLDEGDLLEFWPQCSSSEGWLYEILTDGWLSQESQRQGFLSAHNNDVKEYFVIGCNYCVGVLSWEDPSVSESIR